MKYIVFILLSSLAFISCKKDGDVPPNPFGIDYKDYQDVSYEKGFIMYQNYGGPRIDLALDSAYLLELNDPGITNYAIFLPEKIL